MYEALSSDYDYFVNWDGRLKLELPFLEQMLSKVQRGETPVRALDAACGTGCHAIALAQRGYQVAGADLSAGMIERARENAGQAGAQVEFQRRGFGELSGGFEGFDALLCLGNSLPHLLSAAEVQRALQDFAACLRPGGILLIQNRNFDAVMAQRLRWMGPESHREAGREWLFLRFYDFEADGLITFHVVTLYRQEGAAWEQKVASARLRPQLEGDLRLALADADFTGIQCFGNMQGADFDPTQSTNLVMTAHRAW